MPRRAPSPALSENEVDILDSLFAGAAEYGDSAGAKRTSRGAALDVNDVLDLGLESDDGDQSFIDESLRNANKKTSATQGKGKGSGFTAMGLSAFLLKAITRKGYSMPTPIQRKAVPLILDGKDVVGMARTGAGKTAAFVLPMLEKLKAHSAKFGARALILSPSRELAVQTLKVVKEFSKGTDLKATLLIGGENMQDQFGMMATNPDIIIATPGRFLHLKIEMSLDLSSVKYVVFDEADRLFEMGFQGHLTEILHSLPMARQTLLFSATLPSSLVEFAKAGLQEPVLVRLDTESKLSPDLQLAFFSVKKPEKESALLHILHDIIKVPTGTSDTTKDREKPSKKRKRGEDGEQGSTPSTPSSKGTIIFVSTKHHVEYLASILKQQYFAVSYVYGTLDQEHRQHQVEDFKRGKTQILLTTDVAARGIDLPLIANVVNYDYPGGEKIFVHRVGRTARAGQSGWAYSLVQKSDLPYLLDLQLFLGRKLVVGQETQEVSFAEDIVLGTLKREDVETQLEWITKVLDESEDTKSLYVVAGKAEAQYLRSRSGASGQSVKRSREIAASKRWDELNPLFGKAGSDASETEHARLGMLAKIGSFKPQETIFEVASKSKAQYSEAAEVVRNFRSKTAKIREAATKKKQETEEDEDDANGQNVDGDDFEDFGDENDDNDDPDAWEGDESPADDSDSELEVTVTSHKKSQRGQTSFQDPEHFMSYTPRHVNMAEERSYGVQSGSAINTNFIKAAQDVAMNLTNDEGAKGFGAPTRARLQWDKKSRKYVSTGNNDDSREMIRGESGSKIAASFKSGRFERWRAEQKGLGRLPKIGENENGNLVRNFGGDSNGGKRFKHRMQKAPREADKFRDDYEVRKKRVAEAREKGVGRFADGKGKKGGKGEIKSTEEIWKAREVKEKRRAKNARPARKGRG